MADTFYTAATVPDDRGGLQAFRAGGGWVYADSLETFLRTTRTHAGQVAAVLQADPVCQGGYLPVACQRDPVLSGLERDYLWHAASLACALGEARKLLCVTDEEGQYACYFSAARSDEIAAALTRCVTVLDRGKGLRFKELSRDVFGEVKGSYYWAKCLLEHLVYLGVARHVDKWGVV